MSANYIVLDIETGNAPAEAVEAAIASYKPPRNIKDPMKIEASIKENAEKAKGKAALLDASPILCVAVAWDGNYCVFDGMGADAGVDGVFTMHGINEKGMLEALAIFLEQADEDTVIVGHNIHSFDLPKLRMAYIRNRLPVPPAFSWCQVDDTAKLIKLFSIELRDEFCPSLAETCRVLGIESPKGEIDGSMVPTMHQEGRYAEILKYCCRDVEKTEQAFLMMTGQYEEWRSL